MNTSDDGIAYAITICIFRMNWGGEMRYLAHSYTHQQKKKKKNKKESYGRRSLYSLAFSQLSCTLTAVFFVQSLTRIKRWMNFYLYL